MTGPPARWIARQGAGRRPGLAGRQDQRAVVAAGRDAPAGRGQQGPHARLLGVQPRGGARDAAGAGLGIAQRGPRADPRPARRRPRRARRRHPRTPARRRCAAGPDPTSSSATARQRKAPIGATKPTSSASSSGATSSSAPRREVMRYARGAARAVPPKARPRQRLTQALKRGSAGRGCRARTCRRSAARHPAFAGAVGNCASTCGGISALAPRAVTP